MTPSRLVQIQAPAAPPPLLFPFHSRFGHHILAVEGTRIYDVDGDLDDELQTALTRSRPIGSPAAPPPLRALSLNLAQACNLKCGYCYAGGGSFGQQQVRMDASAARRAVDLLLRDASRDETVVVGFMGGEPLLHRALLHETTRYAARRADEIGVDIRFSITTNGTLINATDAGLFREFEWTVQISIDGEPEINDYQRPSRNGTSAHAGVLRALNHIARAGRPRTLSARATVAHGWPDLPRQLEHLISLGFDDAGFSPAISAAAQALELDDYPRLLNEMVACGQTALNHWLIGKPYPFSNLHTAVEEIHRGTARPYPCGAGAGYLSVSADGGLYACHRFINDESRRMGSLDAGLDDAARAAFLAARHVDRQQPCSGCWARYLCGGGCHHEAIRAGRPACGYIRGWLEFCLGAYVELSNASYFPEPSA